MFSSSYASSNNERETGAKQAQNLRPTLRTHHCLSYTLDFPTGMCGIDCFGK